MLVETASLASFRDYNRRCIGRTSTAEEEGANKNCHGKSKNKIK
jgi:hypothetical protein